MCRSFTTARNFHLTPVEGLTDNSMSIILIMFHGTGKDDAEQHWFTCQVIWFFNKITDEAQKIAQLETTLRDRALQWNMKYKRKCTNMRSQEFR